MVNYIGSDLVGNGVQVSLGDATSHYLAQGVIVVSGSSGGFFVDSFQGFTANLVSITVMGSVYGTGNAIFLSDLDSSSDSNTITIGTTGALTAESQGVYIVGGSNVVSNAGEIVSLFSRGIQLTGDGNVVTNSGRIAGLGIAGLGDAAVVFEGDASRLYNSGLIESLNEDSATVNFSLVDPFSLVTYASSLVNTGIILSAGLAIDATSGSDELTNSGDIFGDVSFGSGIGGDHLINTGLIDGEVTGFGTGGGFVENAGRITGSLVMGDGFDTVYNQGVLDYVGFGAGDDTYVSMGDGRVLRRIDGGSGEDTMLGGHFDDVFVGDADDDILRGRGGDDGLYGGSGNDKLYGGVGADSLYGGDGSDELYGRADDDVLRGEGGDDTLEGGNGDDDIHGGSGSDYLEGGAGDDTLTGGSGIDTLYGGAGDDILIDNHAGLGYYFGDAGNDTINVSKGANTILGGAGNDTIYAGIGDDYISGGSGDDYMDGHGGNNRFYFAQDSGRDFVGGFDHGTDTLVFAIDGLSSFATLSSAISTSNGGGTVIDLTQFGSDGYLVVYVFGGVLDSSDVEFL